MDSGLRVDWGDYSAQKSPGSPDPPGLFASACHTANIRTGHPGKHSRTCNPIRNHSSSGSAWENPWRTMLLVRASLSRDHELIYPPVQALWDAAVKGTDYAARPTATPYP